MTTIRLTSLSKSLQARIKKELAASPKGFSHTDKSSNAVAKAIEDLIQTFKIDLRNFAKIDMDLYKDKAAVEKFVEDHLKLVEPLHEAIKEFSYNVQEISAKAAK